MQALDIGREDEILEIGTDSGYLTHCLALLGARVTSRDLYQDFVAAAKKNLEASAIDNARIECMDASIALPPGAFDVIAITCAVDGDLERFVDALQPGGRLFVVVGQSPVMHAMLITRRTAGDVERSEGRVNRG